MLQNPDYVKQYPGLEPGGPSIIPPGGCQSVAPIIQEPVPDLITSNAVTFKGVGCSHQGNCPPATVARATSTTQSAADTQPSSIAAPGNPSPKTNPTATPHGETNNDQPKSQTAQASPSGSSPPVIVITSSTDVTNSASNLVVGSQTTALAGAWWSSHLLPTRQRHLLAHLSSTAQHRLSNLLDHRHHYRHHQA